MESSQISRSGRVLKKSAKVKEMEDFDINELDVQEKSHKKSKTMDDSGDKRVTPIKISKIFLNMEGGSKKKMIGLSSPVAKQVFKPPFQGSVKAKQDARHSIYHDSSETSQEFDSSSVSSESSSSSSSEASDEEDKYNSEYRKASLTSGMQSSSVHQANIIVEQHQRFESPVYMEQRYGMSSDDSESTSSDTAIVIADESRSYASKNQKGNSIKRGEKKDFPYVPRQSAGRKRPLSKFGSVAAKKKKLAPKDKPPAYSCMLWCTENRKKNYWHVWEYRLVEEKQINLL